MTNETNQDYLANAKSTPSDLEAFQRDFSLYFKEWRAFNDLLNREGNGNMSIDARTLLFTEFQRWRTK